MSTTERLKRKRLAAKAFHERNPTYSADKKKEFYKRNPTYAVDKVREYKARDPEGYAARRNKWQKEFHARNPTYRIDKMREYRMKYPQQLAILRRRVALKALYSLSPNDYDMMLKNQRGRCGICKTQKFSRSGKRPCVDHCHKTNRVRGLLCHRCNMGLGMFFDSVNTLAVAIKYLQGELVWQQRAQRQLSK